MKSDSFSVTGAPMSGASAWRFALAERIGQAYAANPKVAVVMVAGSTGRGTADRYSDLELDVYWTAPPADDERRAAASGGGGSVMEVFDYEDDEWAEQISVAGFSVGTSTFLVETMERYLEEVLEQHSTAPLPQMRLHSLLHAQPRVGNELVARWRARAARYPEGLRQAMLREHLVFDGFGYAEDMLAARDDLLMLYDVLGRVARQLLGALIGLNGIYLPNPGFKSMDELIAQLQLAPWQLPARLRRVFRQPARQAVAELHALVDEVFALVEAQLPDFDTAPYRARLRQRRGVWDQPPAL